jgi:hypothetical protein
MVANRTADLVEGAGVPTTITSANKRSSLSSALTCTHVHLHGDTVPVVGVAGRWNWMSTTRICSPQVYLAVWRAYPDVNVAFLVTLSA